MPESSYTESLETLRDFLLKNNIPNPWFVPCADLSRLKTGSWALETRQN